jgi:hypothetical protein
MEIDVLSMDAEVRGDKGRQTGPVDQNREYVANRGPLIRDNRLGNNDLNGLLIRAGDILTSASVWDDTDIVHVVRDEIFVGNVQHEGGLRLQSSPSESLVVKFDGYGSNFNRYLGAGLTAFGELSTGVQRVGGMLHILGQPGFPVILTSLKDDTVGAGLQPDGRPQTDTNNDGIGSIPQPADWRGVLLDQYSNDRNVVIVLETEDVNAAAPGPNGFVNSAQVLGQLATSASSSGEDRHLGFVVEGVLSQDQDVDVYSFDASAGTEVWIDVDHTQNNLDLVLEVLDADGVVLARSDNSIEESQDPSKIFRSDLIDASSVNPLNTRSDGVRLTSGGEIKEDGSSNPLDPGLRIRLPGTSGNRNTYYFRVRSRGIDINDVSGGLSSGAYQVQVRMREAQEWAGSTVNFADIRYAMNGVHMRGLPASSPLVGDIAEDESVGNGNTTANNGTAIGNGRVFGNPVLSNRPQYVGNLLSTDNGGISIAGELSGAQDLDFYMLDIDQTNIVGGVGSGHASVVFDIDYADGLDRPDTSINIYREEPLAIFGTTYRLVYSGDGSNIAEDQPRPLAVNDMADLSRGSAGNRDAYIGPIALPEGRYLVGISSAARQPRAKLLPRNSTDGVTPIESVRRIVDTGFIRGVTSAEPPVVQNFVFAPDANNNDDFVSTAFDLGSYTAEDLPAIYLPSEPSYQLFVRDAQGVETLLSTTGPVGGMAKVPLSNSSRGYNFAGQNGLRLVVRGAGAGSDVGRVIIGFAERGERVGVSNEPLLVAFAGLGQLAVRDSEVFTLVTYTAAENPQLTFDYTITDGDLDVFVVNQSGIATRVATSVDDELGAGEVLLQDDTPTTASISLARWVGQPGLQIRFETRDDDPTNVSIRAAHIVLSDGARVYDGGPNTTFAGVSVPPGTRTTGKYQLEIRLGDNFFQSNSFGAPTLTRSFDTNDRLANQVSIIAPRGADLTDGDQFAIGDGGRQVVFEFTVDGSVALGAVPVTFSPADPRHVIARRIRDALNDPNVQSRLQVRAASSGGIATGPMGEDAKLNLFGTAIVKTLSAAKQNGEVKVLEFVGFSDRNITRDQGQVLIQNSYIRESRDYGVWSEPAGRLMDPRNIEGFLDRSLLQNKPELVGTQAVRNLPVANDRVIGGIVPGVVIRNNVLEEGGLGGVKVQGESPIWMITPSILPALDNDPTMNNAQNPDHFGALLDDGDYLVIDSDRTRLHFEFEDMAGAPTGGPSFGSGEIEGDGVRPDSVPVYYREEGGQLYHRLPNTPFATTGLETMHALRDAILGSILVSNGSSHQVRATIAESLLGPYPFAPLFTQSGYPEYFNRPAVYLEGVTNIQFINTIGGGNPFDIRRIDLGTAPQSQARIVNNTVIGKDGRASFNGESPADADNGTIQTATQTWQGTSHNPLAYEAEGTIGDGNLAVPSADVDIFQFKLGIGERAIIDVDSSSGLDGVLQIFNSAGLPQPFTDSNGQIRFFSDNDAAPGETLGLDPYIDFTATEPGVYYAALSSVGNTEYDPLSFAGRRAGTTSGDYSISIAVRHLQQFVITAQDASNYATGDTFTIYGVPDIGDTGTSGRTFEFVVGGGAASPGNIPINIGATWRFPDVARAIAKAINEGDAGRPAIPNTQRLDNGQKGFASPLPAVHAIPLGGLAGVIHAPLNDIVGDRALFLNRFADASLNLVDGLGFNHLSDREVERILNGPFWEINQGLELFTRRNDGFLITTTTTIGGGRPISITTSMGNLGIGHDRNSTTPLSQTSWADGTNEKFVVVKNAAYIDGQGSILVDPDADGTHNLDQLLPESGVLATRGASPTILNNVFFNLQTPVVAEESRRFPLTGGPAPYGSDNPNFVIKPGEIVVGGSIFQYHEPAVSNVRFGTGIERGPTNVPNTSLDLNFEIPNGVRLFVNAQASEYLPAAGSPLIDSAVDAVPERPSLAGVKNSVGISPSPVLAPNFDLVGQLRADDPDVAPPGGLGPNVFKDRGALDRADFEGPAAIMLSPVDNDSLGIDKDGAVSVIQLDSGSYPEFRIQLADGNEPSNSLRGLGIDDNTVVNSLIENRQLRGTTVVVFENGRLLRENFDYRFAYNATRDEIVLTPLAGVWKNGAVYQISINNKDRFVVTAPAGDQVTDGDAFTITDSAGGIVYFEFESGYQLQVPHGLVLQIPLAGGANGGVTDGDRFSITVAGVRTTFEFDRNSNFLPGNIPIAFEYGDSQQQIVNAVFAAIDASSAAVFPRIMPDGRIFLGASAGTLLDTSFSAIGQPPTTQAIRIPDLGPRPGGIVDGQVFTISDGRRTVNFEYDTNGSVQPGNVAIDFSSAIIAEDVAAVTLAALRDSVLNIAPTLVSPKVIYLGLSLNGSVAEGTSALSVVGVSRALSDGRTFAITTSAGTETFEFDSDGSSSSGNIAIPIALSNTEAEIGQQISDAIAGAGLGLNPRHVGDGNVAIGGVASDRIDVSTAPELTLFGQPGVRTSTRLQVFGPLLLNVPVRGAADITEDETFTISHNGTTVRFEFDSNFSGPSRSGNVVIPYNPISTQADIASATATAINGAGLGIVAINLGNGVISLGALTADQVGLSNSSLTQSRGVVSDGEYFTISNGSISRTFEFEDVDRGNGFVIGRTPILYSSSSTADSVVESMRAAIAAAGLGLQPTAIPGGILQLNDTPVFTTDISTAPTLLKSGVPGGAKPVSFLQDISFSGEQMKRSIIDAINNALNTPLASMDRGGATLFVENAVLISPELNSFFLRGVADLAGNSLKPNRINDATEFTILMPGVTLDYGDAPDPFTTTSGRYPTLHSNDGARHVISTSALLGAGIDAEANGQPSAMANADTDDGVVFGANLNQAGVFNRHTLTPIEVTLSSAGFVDAWIDFNADGDWDDPGEKILDSVRFTDQSLTQTFMITVPATAPVPQVATTTFARFRSSTTGGLVPTGLATDGEVEDYMVVMVPGTPPVAVNDRYFPERRWLDYNFRSYRQRHAGIPDR